MAKSDTDESNPRFERDGYPTALLDAYEAAAYLAISRDALKKLVQSGAIPHIRMGSAVRYAVADIHEFLKERASTDWIAHGKPSNG